MRHCILYAANNESTALSLWLNSFPLRFSPLFIFIFASHFHFCKKNFSSLFSFHRTVPTNSKYYLIMAKLFCDTMIIWMNQKRKISLEKPFQFRYFLLLIAVHFSLLFLICSVNYNAPLCVIDSKNAFNFCFSSTSKTTRNYWILLKCCICAYLSIFLAFSLNHRKKSSLFVCVCVSFFVLFFLNWENRKVAVRWRRNAREWKVYILKEKTHVNFCYGGITTHLFW